MNRVFKDVRIGIVAEITAGYVEAGARLTEARLFSRSLMLASLKLRRALLERQLPEPFGPVVAQLEEMTEEQEAAFLYISHLSDLVYSTTLFDSFLADVTKCMLLWFPKSLGKNTAVTLDALLQGRSRDDLIAQAVSKRVREIGFLSFGARLDLLKTTFGLELKLAPEVLTALEHFAGVRNVVIHDQSTYSISTEGSVVKLEHKGATPTPLTFEDVQRATATYRATAYALAEAIIVDVLRGNDDHEAREVMAVLRRGYETQVARRSAKE